MRLKSSLFSSDQRLQKAADNNPPLKRGERGEAVRLVQESLVNLGFPLPGSTNAGSLDGIYGGEVVQKISEFQRRQKLQVDGVAGKQTLLELDAILTGAIDLNRDQKGSFFDPYQKAPSPGSPTQPVARLYFPTAVHTLDVDDLEILNQIARFYFHLVAQRKRFIRLYMVGFADHRGSEQDNQRLAMNRALSVQRALDQAISPVKSLYYESEVRSRGELRQHGGDLALDRRVDVYSNYVPQLQTTVDMPPLIFKNPNYKGPLSSRFEIRTFSGGSIAPFPGASPGATWLNIEVRNMRTRKTARYSYSGVGVASGLPAGVNLPTGFNEVKIRYDDPRDAQRAWFDVEDLEGPGNITAAGGGFSHTTLTFEGPKIRGRTKRAVKMEMTGFDLAVGAMRDLAGKWYRSP